MLPIPAVTPVIKERTPMPWTATLKSVSTDGGNVVANVEYSNGTETITKPIKADDLTQQRIAEEAHVVIASLDKRDAAKADIDPLVDTEILPLEPERPTYRLLTSAEIHEWSTIRGVFSTIKDAAENPATLEPPKTAVRSAWLLISTPDRVLDLNEPGPMGMVDVLVAGGILSEDDKANLLEFAGWVE